MHSLTKKNINKNVDINTPLHKMLTICRIKTSSVQPGHASARFSSINFPPDVTTHGTSLAQIGVMDFPNTLNDNIICNQFLSKAQGNGPMHAMGSSCILILWIILCEASQCRRVSIYVRFILGKWHAPYLANGMLRWFATTAFQTGIAITMTAI